MRRMSEDSIPETSAPPAPVQAAPVVRPATGTPLVVLNAITDPMRYAVLRELADGSYPPVITLAKRLSCHPDQMGRHLQRMKKAGLLVRVNPGEDSDQRAKYYQIPAAFRSSLPDGTRVLDFGSVVLRFENA